MSDSSRQKVRDGKLYRFILGNSELSSDLHEVFKAWLDSAAEDFPYFKPDKKLESLQDDLLKLARDRHIWFCKYFGNSNNTVTKEES